MFYVLYWEKRSKRDLEIVLFVRVNVLCIDVSICVELNVLCCKKIKLQRDFRAYSNKRKLIMSKINIVSMNCRGLANIEKRRVVLQFFKLNKNSFVLFTRYPLCGK